MLNAENLLRQIAQRREHALEQGIRRYGGYVYTVVHNRCRDMLTREDQEELVSDVFSPMCSSHSGSTRARSIRSVSKAGLAVWRATKRRTRSAVRG